MVALDSIPSNNGMIISSHSAGGTIGLFPHEKVRYSLDDRPSSNSLERMLQNRALELP